MAQKSKKTTAWVLFILCMVVYNANLREISGNDTLPTRYLPISILRRASFDLREFAFIVSPHTAELPYYAQERRGRIVSSSPVLPAIMNAPFYFLALRYGLEPRHRVAIDLLSKFATSFWVSLSVVVMFYVFALFVEQKRAKILALIYAFGTLTWPVSSQAAWQHGTSQLFLAITLYLFLRINRGEEKLMPQIGISLALAIMARPGSSLAALVIIIYLAIKYRRKTAPAVLALCVTLIPLMSYNLYYFDSILGGYAALMGQSGVTTELYGLQGRGVMSGNMIKGLSGIFFSPNRGILIFMPCLMFAFWGMFKAYREEEKSHTAITTAVIVTLLWYSRFYAWWGGWSFGLRYSTDLLPFICLFFVFILEDVALSKWLRSSFLLSVVVSIFIQSVGAFCFDIDRWNFTPVDVDVRPSRLWDWGDTLIGRCLLLGPITPDVVKEKKGMPLRRAYWHAEQGFNFLTQGQEDQARAHWERAVEMDPFYPEVFYNLGVYWARRGIVEKARACFDRTLLLNPEHKGAAQAVGQLLKGGNNHSY